MNKPVRIINQMNGKCLTVSQGQFKTKHGDLIVQTYTKSYFQHFLVNMVGQNFVIQSMGDTSLSIDIPAQSKNVFEKIIAYKHHGNKNQQFKLINCGSEHYLIVSALSSLVLEIMGGIDAQGMPVVQNVDYKNKNQMWRIEKV